MRQRATPPRSATNLSSDRCSRPIWTHFSLRHDNKMFIHPHLLTQVAEGEARVSVLQREVDKLSQALLKAQENESLLKERTASLNMSLNEATTAHSSSQSRLAALQKSLTVSEQEKQQLQVSDTEVKQ